MEYVAPEEVQACEETPDRLAFRVSLVGPGDQGRLDAEVKRYVGILFAK